MFYKKGEKLLDEQILNKVCDLMNVQPTEEYQEFFVKDTMEINNKSYYLKKCFKANNIFKDEKNRQKYNPKNMFNKKEVAFLEDIFLCEAA